MIGLGATVEQRPHGRGEQNDRVTHHRGAAQWSGRSQEPV